MFKKSLKQVCVITTDTENFIIDMFIHGIILTIILTAFFLLVVSKLETEALQSEIDKAVKYRQRSHIRKRLYGKEDMFNFLRVQPYRSHEQLLRHHDLRVRQNHLYLNGRTRYNNNYSGWNIRIGGRW